MIFVSNFEDWLPAAVREDLRVDLFVFAELFVPAIELHFLALVFLEELLRREQIVSVVLLEDRKRVALRERFHMHRVRLDLRRHVAKLERDAARAEIDIAHLAHEAEPVGVDREPDRFAICAARDARLGRPGALCRLRRAAARNSQRGKGCERKGSHGRGSIGDAPRAGKISP